MLDCGFLSVRYYGCSDGETNLGCQAGKVVGGLQGAGDALLDVGVAAVIGAQDGVLEAAGVLELESKLAVLALLGDGDAGADGGNVSVVDQGDDTAVIGEDCADGALGTSSTASANLEDFDLY